MGSEASSCSHWWNVSILYRTREVVSDVLPSAVIVAALSDHGCGSCGRHIDAVVAVVDIDAGIRIICGGPDGVQALMSAG